MFRGVSETATWTTEKIAALRALMADPPSTSARASPASTAASLSSSSSCSRIAASRNVVSAGIAKRQTASVYLKSLAEVGVLREVMAGREKLFLHPKFLDLLLSDEAHLRALRRGTARPAQPPTRDARPGTKARKASKPDV